MRRIILVVLAAAALDASAFFEPKASDDDNPIIRRPAPAQPVAGISCALQIRYNAPDNLLLTYVGGGDCYLHFERAIMAVPVERSVAGEKVSVGGERARPTVYLCGIDVSFNTDAPTAPQVSYTGAGCESSRATAMVYARQAVACVYAVGSVPCRPQ